MTVAAAELSACIRPIGSPAAQVTRVQQQPLQLAARADTERGEPDHRVATERDEPDHRVATERDEPDHRAATERDEPDHRAASEPAFWRYGMLRDERAMGSAGSPCCQSLFSIHSTMLTADGAPGQEKALENAVMTMCQTLPKCYRSVNVREDEMNV